MSHEAVLWNGAARGDVSGPEARWRVVHVAECVLLERAVKAVAAGLDGGAGRAAYRQGWRSERR